ncbi:malonyl CoA-acyl carrier protein transacylase [Orenia metallireducens]|uniref:Malonyl CoA-acyl carrier protein transacylase n=1 Tax=Orenia metallireducens TaxID=1413210 RepID=A0A1C0A727_9FIRM|nr:ACP S-malonyltransferase [Orenia metallireducens]OCL26053.1 malonyl CoA-acyl carrier protein transacylase [Orenia metallireducens]
MGKVAFIFPGQGSQQVGMGADLVEEFAVAKETFAEADNALDIDISKLCFEGPAEDLQKTSNTQPAILTTSIAVYRVLKEKGIEPDIVAGHSLGEYSALVAAGVLDFTDAVKLVRKRGQLMEEADGTMAAIIGLNAKEVEELCQKASTAGIVEPANYNCPGQIVISGEKEGVEQATKLAQEAGAKKAVILNVSGPFHSSLMEPAGEKLSKELAEVTLNDAQVPVVTNINAEFTTKDEDFVQALIKQISGSVRWEESVKAMIEDGVDTFVEVGPGRVLKGFMRRIDRKVTALNVEDLASLEKTLKKL